jgi:hypothetical protein
MLDLLWHGQPGSVAGHTRDVALLRKLKTCAYRTIDRGAAGRRCTPCVLRGHVYPPSRLSTRGDRGSPLPGGGVGCVRLATLRLSISSNTRETLRVGPSAGEWRCFGAGGTAGERRLYVQRLYRVSESGIFVSQSPSLPVSQSPRLSTNSPCCDTPPAHRRHPRVSR